MSDKTAVALPSEILQSLDEISRHRDNVFEAVEGHEAVV